MFVFIGIALTGFSRAADTLLTRNTQGRIGKAPGWGLRRAHRGFPRYVVAASLWIVRGIFQ
jgi:hypothetical protein